MQRFVTPENKKWWTLGAVVGRAVHDHARQHRRERRAAVDRSATSASALSELEWVVAGYALTFAAFMLTGGKLADCSAGG